MLYRLLVPPPDASSFHRSASLDQTHALGPEASVPGMVSTG